MGILEGLFLINDADVYVRFGAFLAEKSDDGNENYDSILLPPKLKDQRKESLEDEDGERMLDQIVQVFDGRDITLQFAIAAPDSRTFLSRYFGFIKFLKEGENGWLTLKLTDVGLQFRVLMTSFSRYSQLVPFGNGLVAARFSVKFREPNPTFEIQE